jgi:hypothetical protein
MPFFITHNPQEHTPGYVEVWGTPFPTRVAAEHALRARARETPAILEAAYRVVEAPSHRAAREQLWA